MLLKLGWVDTLVDEYMVDGWIHGTWIHGYGRYMDTWIDSIINRSENIWHLWGEGDLGSKIGTFSDVMRE